MARDEWTVEIVRSRKRRKTVQADRVGNLVRVYMPANLSGNEEVRWVDEMLGRMERRERRERAHARVDLEQRAALLSARHLDGCAQPTSVRWVTNMTACYGTCTPEDGTIRISDWLVNVPDWVLDYVLVHELVHLLEPSHNSRFWALVARYPRAERARGYLMATEHASCDA